MGTNKKWHEYIAAEDDDQRRFDRVLRKMFPHMKLSHIYKIIRQGETRLNGKRVKPSAKVTEGDKVSVMSYDESGEQLPAHSEVPDRPRTAPLSALSTIIVLENRHVLALNKPPGLLVHGPNSLDTAVQRYLAPSLPRSLSFKPGPVHRLDRNTSGIILFAKTLKAARTVTKLLKIGQIEKYYIGILDGEVRKHETWKDSLARDWDAKKTLPERDRPHSSAGQLAITEIFPAETAAHATLALFRIHTGRTHQIRAQAGLHNHALSGDTKYGGSSLLPRYLLHAVAIKMQRAVSLLDFNFLGATLPSQARTIIPTLFGTEGLKGLDRLLGQCGISMDLLKPDSRPSSP
jgi:23S rRNA pseudouridine955/2504/2580 synthase